MKYLVVYYYCDENNGKGYGNIISAVKNISLKEQVIQEIKENIQEQFENIKKVVILNMIPLGE